MQYQTKIVDGISRATCSKYWATTEYNQQRTKENTLTWSRNKNNALQMAEEHVTQATESQRSLLEWAAIILPIFLNSRHSKDTVFKGSVTVDNKNEKL